MKIFINYNNNKKLLNTKDYQSVYSIVHQFLYENNINIDINNYFIDYNGLYLNYNFSLEKYNIKNESILNLNKKTKGGNSFFKFLFKNPFKVFFIFLLVLIPVFILPLGFIPLTATLIKLIIENSIDKVGSFLACTLGKVTLYKRIRLFLFFIKYIVFILMIYVIISFPLVLLSITMKGNDLMDNPKSMCGAISAGGIAGMVLTFIFVFIYLLFRGGNLILSTMINLFKKVYFLDTLFNPMLSSLMNLYNTSKYLPINIIPFVGWIITGYFTFLSVIMPSLEIFLGTITNLGCSQIFNKDQFSKLLLDKVNKYTASEENKKNNNTENNSENNNNENNNNENNNNENNNNKNNNKEENKNNKETSFSFRADENDLCRESLNQCCHPSNFCSIADSLTSVLTNSISSKFIKSNKLFPSFVLFTEALYEAALSYASDNQDFMLQNSEEKKYFLRRILEEKRDVISNDTKEIIKDFLKDGNNTLIVEIKNKLNKEIPQNSSNLVKEIQSKLINLEMIMINFSKENKSHYVQGKSLFKTIFRQVFLNIFCNIMNTSKSSLDIISQAGEMSEMIDMLKAGTITGFITSIFYLITVIILIICGIFNIY